MFGSSLGFQEILVICVILIVVVGPERLPNMMKGVGKAMRTMREASREIRSSVGIDELMREDVMRPPPQRPRPSPPATVARAALPPAGTAPASATEANAPPAEPGTPVPATAAEPASTTAAPTPPSDPKPS